jgi:hypothetical protein
VSPSVEKSQHKPRVFIGSSSEATEIADAVAHVLRDDAYVFTWNSAFNLSSTVIETLERNLDGSDFGVLILAADDQRKSRDREAAVPRDNVVLELGMFIGGLGRARSFLVIPDDATLKLPSDILSVTPATYDPSWAETEPQEALSVAAGQIRSAIRRLGPRPKSHVGTGSDTSGGDVSSGLPPGAEDGWRYFATKGLLAPLRPSDLGNVVWVVHARHGLGRVIGFDPEATTDRTVTIRFSSGIAQMPMGLRSLFHAEPK